MTHSDIFKLRLVSQQLVGTECKSITELVAKMGALQAQDYPMSKWAIGIRMPGINNLMVEEAITRGEILRTHVLRPTWHWVTPENIRWMLQLTAPKIKAIVATRNRDLRLDETIFEKSNRWIIELLSGKNYLTRQELQSEFANRGLQLDSIQMSHLTMRAELDAIICSGPSKGRNQTYALIDEYVPNSPTFTREEGLGKLAALFFSSHGPASLDDFVWWSGLNKTEARQGLEMNKSQLVSGKCDDMEYWMKPGLQIKDYDPVHFLPAFDEFIVSYKNRTMILHAEHHKKVISVNGMFSPVVIAEDRVIGTWKKITKKNQVDVEQNLFQKHAPSGLNSLISASFQVQEFFNC